MYFIRHGTVEVINAKNEVIDHIFDLEELQHLICFLQVVATLSDGAFFGEIGLLVGKSNESEL